MSEQPEERRISRRQTITGIGLAGVAISRYARAAQAQEVDPTALRPVRHYPSVSALKAALDVRAGDWVQTAGFHAPGDGGAALYRLQEPGEDLPANGADVIALGKGLVAVLTESNGINYRMFGARCDGEADDGVQIRRAHEYANRRQVPVINLTGEFWIKQTNDIPITTPVQWGKTLFHVDERYNARRTPRFVVRNDHPTKDLTEDEDLRNALVQKLKPGVQIIAELAPYAGHLMSVQDAEDRIGIRAGYAGNKGWAREELFYVEEEGRIVGDIAWEFKNLTSVKATPCNDNYLVIEGGQTAECAGDGGGCGPAWRRIPPPEIR